MQSEVRKKGRNTERKEGRGAKLKLSYTGKNS